MFTLMEQVQEKEIPFAVIDSSLWDLERAFFPRLEKALTLDDPKPIAYALEKTQDRSFSDEVDMFLQEQETSGDLDALVADFFSDQERFTVAGSLVLRKRLDQRLPTFEPLFRQVAKDYGMDWILLATISYQESHWDPDAKSFTGVRGLMMLTLPTAREFGITNRTDPEQSVRGGAGGG